MNKDILILGCSNRKLPLVDGETMKAGSLYDGVMYRVFKAWSRRHPVPWDFHVFIVSAKYGLITWDTPIASYDQRMIKARAQQLRPQVERTLQLMPRMPPESVYVELGKEYLRALPDLSEQWPNTRVIYGYGRIGERMQRLKIWLESITESHRLELLCP